MSCISLHVRKNLASYPFPIGILIFGSIWGLLESTLGGAFRLGFGSFFKTQLHICPCPLLAFAFGLPVMAAALAIYKKPVMLLGIGLVAAPFSWLVIPLQNVPAFTTPLTTYPIVNPTVAIVLSSIIFSLIASLTMKKLPMSTSTLMGMGALACALSSIAFIYIVVYLGAPILNAVGLSGPIDYIVTNTTIFIAMSAATVPLGYLTGLKLQPGVSHLFRIRPWLHRVGPLAVLVLCWGASVAAIAAGL